MSKAESDESTKSHEATIQESTKTYEAKIRESTKSPESISLSDLQKRRGLLLIRLNQARQQKENAARAEIEMTGAIRILDELIDGMKPTGQSAPERPSH